MTALLEPIGMCGDTAVDCQRRLEHLQKSAKPAEDNRQLLRPGTHCCACRNDAIHCGRHAQDLQCLQKRRTPADPCCLTARCIACNSPCRHAHALWLSLAPPQQPADNACSMAASWKMPPSLNPAIRTQAKYELSTRRWVCSASLPCCSVE